MQQNEFPFRDSAEDATTAAIHKSGKPFKSVAAELWPALKLDTAYARLKACLDESKRDKLTADEHILIATVTGQFDFVHYVAMSCSHDVTRVEPEDQAAALRRQFIDSVTDLKQIYRRLGNLEV